MSKSPRLAALAMVLAATSGPALPQDGSTGASGFGKVRIEQEDRIFVPPERAQATWEFVVRRLVDDQEFLKSLDPAFTSRWSEELFVDRYFDTPSMQLYAAQSSVRHRTRTNLSDPEDRKSGRELMQIKLNDISGNALERGEIKFEIEHPAERNSAMDNHPMFGIVKPSQRGLLQQRLAEQGIDGKVMQHVLTVRDIRRRVYILKDAKPFMSISHDQASSSLWWASTSFCELEPELNEIGFTEADARTREYMETVLHKVIGEVNAAFPDLKRDLTPKYNRSFDALSKQVPFLSTLVRVGLHQRYGMLLFFAALALAAFAAYTLLRKRARQRAEAGSAAAAAAAGPVAAAQVQRR